MKRAPRPSSSRTSTASPGDPHDITIQNNFFGTVPDAYFVIATQTPVIQTCLNIAILYNTFSTSPTTMSGCTTKVNTRIVGNVGPRGSGCESGASYSHNVWQYASNSPCGASDKVVVGSSGTQLLGLTNPLLGDMHLTAGSPADRRRRPRQLPRRRLRRAGETDHTRRRRRPALAGEAPERSRRRACDQRVVRHVVRDDRVRAHDRALPDAHAWKEGDVLPGQALSPISTGRASWSPARGSGAMVSSYSCATSDT